MANAAYREIIALIRRAAERARSLGIVNLLQPGLVKEMIIADLLGHELIVSKRDADAQAPGNPDEKYEYLSCLEGGSGQLDRMFKSPAEKRQQSLRRITRNSRIYLAVFRRDRQTECKAIYELATDALLAEAEHQLDRSQNRISHVAFPESWAKANGKLVYKA